MNVECNKYQSMVEPFLAKKLTGPECQQFINHVKSCKQCMDELEVYHVIYSVVEQLDSDKEDENSNYMETLQEKLTTTMKEHTRKRNIYWWIAACILMVVLGVCIWFFLLR